MVDKLDAFVDFSGSEELVNNYDGAAWKHPIVYNGDRYLLKYGDDIPENERNPLEGSHENTPISEHLGSRAFELMGVPSQKTMLGTYHGEIVVACKDFVYEMGHGRYELVEFRQLEKSFAGRSSRVKKTPSYDNIVGVFDTNAALAPIAREAEDRYWRMLVGDAMLGNFDRHAGNWGYILDTEENRFVAPAPVYDCGSCLSPRISEEAMADVLATSGKMRERVMSFPHAAILVNGKRPTYQEFFASPEGERCRRSLVFMFDSIDLDKLADLVNRTPGLSPTQRRFHIEFMRERYEGIIRPAYELGLRELIAHDLAPERRKTISKAEPTLSAGAHSTPATKRQPLCRSNPHAPHRR